VSFLKGSLGLLVVALVVILSRVPPPYFSCAAKKSKQKKATLKGRGRQNSKEKGQQINHLLPLN